MDHQASDNEHQNDPDDRSRVTPWNRTEVAAYLDQHRERVKAVARRKLTRNARALFDSEEVLSSVMRRLDELAHRGCLRPRSEGELWSLVATIAANTAVSKTRLAERAKTLIQEDGGYTESVFRRFDKCSDNDAAAGLLYELLCYLPCADDRQILLLRLRGATYRVIADTLNIAETACRQRWVSLCQKLATAFESGGERDR